MLPKMHQLSMDAGNHPTNNKVGIFPDGTKDDIILSTGDAKVVNDSKKVPKRYFWSGGLGLILALANSCFFYCAWPQQHIFLVPNAWHEFMTTAAVSYTHLRAHET